jgi:hypothetical protein
MCLHPEYLKYCMLVYRGLLGALFKSPIGPNNIIIARPIVSETIDAGDYGHDFVAVNANSIFLHIGSVTLQPLNRGSREVNGEFPAR